MTFSFLFHYKCFKPHSKKYHVCSDANIFEELQPHATHVEKHIFPNIKRKEKKNSNPILYAK